MKNLFATILIFISGFTHADVFENISKAIKTSNASEIARHFGTTVDLSIINNEELYSKSQAEQLLRIFFQKNPVRSFAFSHNGVSKEGAKYAIGKIISTQGTIFRVYILIKQKGSEEFIQEFRIETE